MQSDTVVIAGAGGFVGRALIDRLLPGHRVIALSRHGREDEKNIVWRSCDLFSLLQTEEALSGADVAVYLVHSMLPAHLTQAKFEDMDLILADNFARAAKKNGIRQIVYLGGLIPDYPEGTPLSRHLESRREVEQVLAGHGVPVTTLRAGIIIGAGGSSFEMMSKLVKHLPVMLCPKWTTTLTEPIAIRDMVGCLAHVIGKPEHFSKQYDVGCGHQMSYVAMLRLTASLMGRNPIIATVPFLTPQLSVLWVCLVTGAHRELVKPLVDSLKHKMVARDHALQEEAGIPTTSFEDAVRGAIAPDAKTLTAKIRSNLARSDSTTRQKQALCSIQRLPLPPGRNALWVAEEYARWLPMFFRGMIRVKVGEGQELTFRLVGIPMLKLKLSRERSSPDRPLFYVTGGYLAGGLARDGYAPGRLEFRSTYDSRHVMASVFNFRPQLPWWLYCITQAPAHLFVMNAFGRHLLSIDKAPAREKTF